VSEFTTVASLAEVLENGMKTVQLNGANLLLVRRDGRVYALEDR